MDHGGEVMSQFYTTPPAPSPPAPGEGPPPCQRFVLFDGRVASHIDTSLCDEDHKDEYRFYVIAGMDDGDMRDGMPHDDCPVGRGALRTLVVRLSTDDPAAAEAAWERAERWVRTGMLDEA